MSDQSNGVCTPFLDKPELKSEYLSFRLGSAARDRAMPGKSLSSLRCSCLCGWSWQCLLSRVLVSYVDGGNI